MFLITFSKAGQEDIVLTEDDLFDFQYEASCYSGETFELGGVNAKTLYLLIDNNTQRFSRGTFANCRVKLEIDGKFFGYYNTELPKRRNGVIELTAYDDMVKLDTEFPTDYTFPQTFWAVYAQCVFEAGLASEVSFDNVVLNGAWDNGIISADYTQYIYANSCRNLVAGMAEWNGGYAHINDDGKLQIDKFSKIVSREYRSGDLMELDYSDETVTFSKVKTSQKNKTYEMGTDDGYTLVLNNQYIGYGLDDTSFETALEQIYNYYKGFDLTPMSFTLAEPDFDLRIGDRVKVCDEEEQVTVVGNVSKIVISGNCSMTVICGGFENVSSHSNFTPTSYSQVQQASQDAKGDRTAEKLVSTTQTSYAAVQDGQGLCMFQNGALWAFLQRASNGFMLSGTNASHLTISSDYPKQLVELSSGGNMIILNNHDEKGIMIEVDNTTRLWVYQRGKFYLRPSGLSFVNSKNITYRFEATNEGWAIHSTTDDTGRKLEAKADGLYYNGKKVLLEG